MHEHQSTSFMRIEFRNTAQFYWMNPRNKSLPMSQSQNSHLLVSSHVTPNVNVLQGDHSSLLSCVTAQDLHFIDVQVSHLSDELTTQYPKLFKGNRKQVSEELEQQGIIEKVDGGYHL